MMIMSGSFEKLKLVVIYSFITYYLLWVWILNIFIRVQILLDWYLYYLNFKIYFYFLCFGCLFVWLKPFCLGENATSSRLLFVDQYFWFSPALPRKRRHYSTIKFFLFLSFKWNIYYLGIIYIQLRKTQTHYYVYSISNLQMCELPKQNTDTYLRIKCTLLV